MCVGQVKGRPIPHTARTANGPSVVGFRVWGVGPQGIPLTSNGPYSLTSSMLLIPPLTCSTHPWQVPLEFAVGTLRLSTGRHTTLEEVDLAVELIVTEARAQGVV